MPGKLLVVDDLSTNRLVLRAILEREYYSVDEADCGMKALEKIAASPPDLILLDVEMPDMSGHEICRRVKENPKTQKIPVIMITASDNQEDRHRGLGHGADDFLTKPIDPKVLYVRVRNLLRLKYLLDEMEARSQIASDLGFEIDIPEFSAENPARVAMIAKSGATVEAIAGWVDEQTDFSLARFEDEEEALARIAIDPPDAVVVGEVLASGVEGLRLIAEIRSDWRLRSLAIVFLDHSEGASGLRALEMGASDYLLCPGDLIEFIARLNTQLKRKLYTDAVRHLVDSQMRLSIIDPLTELHNRRYLEHYLPKMLARARGNVQEIAVMMLDLDKFKSLNDMHGHEFGDQVLVEFAGRVKENLRAADLVVRHGGEEFLIIAPNVDIELARNIAERIRSHIEEKPFRAPNGVDINVTVSIGVCIAKAGELDFDAVVRRADDALYKAKQEGRNQVSFAAA